MMSLWEKIKITLKSYWKNEKNELNLFWKKKKKNIIMLFCEIYSICIASYFFITFIITDLVEQNFYFTLWYVFGVGVTCFGIFGMIYSLFSFGTKMKFNEKLSIIWKVIGLYVGVKLVFSLIAGMLATVLSQYVNNIEQVKNLIDRIIQIGTGPLNAFVLLFFIKLLYDLPWNSVKNSMLLTTVIFYALDILLFLLQIFGSSIGALGVRAIITACMITGILTYALFNMSKDIKIEGNK